MICDCKQTVSIPTSPGHIMFSFEKEVLLPNFTRILQVCQIGFVQHETNIKVDTDNIRATLYAILCHDDGLIKGEREAVRVLYLQEGETLDYTMMSRTKTLQQYWDISHSDFLIDILDRGALTSHFQPVIDIRQKNLFGYECLARGVGKDGSLVSPGRLFEAARRCGLTFNLDRQARESALKTGAVKNIKEHLLINFLPTTIYNPETCLQDTFKWAKSLEYDYSKIIFEVVETEKVEDFDHLAHILSYYREQGVKTALDDVGSGFSNLNALIKLKPDIIKIDREIVDHIHEDKLKQSIFEALVRISKENHITVLAEGVEKEEEFHFVRQNGADLVQGFLFGKPNVEPIRTLPELF